MPQKYNWARQNVTHNDVIDTLLIIDFFFNIEIFENNIYNAANNNQNNNNIYDIGNIIIRIKNRFITLKL